MHLRKHVHVTNSPLDLVSSSDAAAVLGVSIPTVNRWARSGKLQPAHKVPGIRGAYLFHRRVVEAKLNDRLSGAA